MIWKYILAAFLVIMGVIEILLALNKPLRDEIMKNSPIKSNDANSRFLLLAGLSAFVMALLLLFYDRIF
jgi:hypothetical protein